MYLENQIYEKDSLGGIIKDLNPAEEPEDLRIIYPDQRTVQSGFKNYNNNIKLGYPAEVAGQLATRSMISKMCYGNRGNRTLNGANQKQFLETIAKEVKLLPLKKDLTGL
jgi:hypothetical protein